jgi:general nucleoside transport system permease protein
MSEFVANWLAAVPANAVPYALAALGLIISERSGVLNLTAEGLMLVGALVGIGVSITLGGFAGVALGVAMAAAAAVSLLFVVMVVVLRVNQVIAGLSIVFFCQGLTGLLGIVAHWQNKQVPGLGILTFRPFLEIPIIGRFLFAQDAVVYLTVAIFFLVNWWLSSTITGLRTRAVGESPSAADAAGISVPFYRALAIVIGSLLIGLAGAYMSVVNVKLWVPGMTGGRGWIAVALVVFARWRPWSAFFGAILFGCIEAIIPYVGAAGVRVPQYLMLMTPYAATLAVMMWVGITQRGINNEPGALGQPHVREERH